MEGITDIQRPTRAMLHGWSVFALVIIASTILFGPVALVILSLVASVALVLTGARSSGWPRPVLIVAGVLLVLPLLVTFLDLTFGQTILIIR